MKIVKYISMLSAIAFIFASCEENTIEYDAKTLTNEAEFQLHYMVPVAAASVNYIYKIEIDGVDITNNKVSLATYNAQPSAGIGRYYVAEAKSTNIKLYQRKDGEDVLVYNQDVNLAPGKQNVVVHDFESVPVVFDAEYPFINDNRMYDTDTIQHVKFYNLLYEKEGEPTKLKLQYQYQYTLHPIYTLEDEKNGKIPEGKEVGDATGDKTKSAWLNLGKPVGFGETTGYQPVPVKKTTYLSSGTARIDYRIIVTEGGTENVNMDEEGRLTGYDRSDKKITTYNDYWNGAVGRRYHHFFSGTRNGAPGYDVASFSAL